MSFHVYVEAELELQLNALCQKMGRKRNSVVREALREYVERRMSVDWPAAVFNFRPDPALPRFEAARTDLLPDRDDIFSGGKA